MDQPSPFNCLLAMVEQGTLAARWRRGKEHPSDGTVTPDGSLRGGVAVGEAGALLTDEMTGGWGCGLVVEHSSSIHEDLASIPSTERQMETDKAVSQSVL